MTLKRHEGDVQFADTQFKRAADDTGRVVAYAATFGNLDRNGERIQRGAFSKSIAAHPSLPLLWCHDQAEPVGRVVNMVEDEKGLLIEATINRSSDAGRNAYANVLDGTVDTLSVGYRVVQRDGPLLTELELLEVSLVTIPANPLAKVLSVKSSKLDFKRHLRAGGLSRSLVEKVVEISWPIIADGADDGEVPACDYCGSKRGEQHKCLLEWNGRFCCGDCATELGRAAYEQSIDTDAIAKRVDELSLQLKSLRKP